MILMADLDGDEQVSFEEFFKLIGWFQGCRPPNMVGQGHATDGRRFRGWRGTTAG